jgi:hypothetical protein
LSLDVLHDNEISAIDFGNFMNAADVGMIEGGCSFGLAEEAFVSGWIQLQLLREKLESDFST